MRSRKLAAMSVIVILAAAAGCSEQSNAPGDQLESMSGTVVSVRDEVPVDGPAMVALSLVDGGRVNAYLPSLFTQPPPDAQTIATFERVYPVILRLEPGDRVLARGTTDNQGLRLESLTVLLP